MINSIKIQYYIANDKTNKKTGILNACNKDKFPFEKEWAQ